MTSRPWLRPVIKGLLRLAFRVYYRSIQVQGMEHFPREGPVLLVANHPSSLLDPAVLVYLLSRPVHFGAKHTLFSGPFGAVLEAFGAIPLVRAQDDRRPMERNLEAFERFTALLGEGRVTAIFPEGLTQDEPHLSPVKTGAARIALQAEDAAGFTLKLTVVPVGLQFEPRRRFRADAFVRFGEPFTISDLAPRHAEAPRRAVQELTDRIDAALKRVAYHIESTEQIPLVERLADVYARRAGRTGIAGVRGRGLRGELLQRIAACLNHYAGADPKAVEHVERALAHYERLRERAGIDRRLLEEPARLLPGPLAPVQATAEAIIGLVPALFGLLTGAIPYFATKRFAHRASARDGNIAALSFRHILAGGVMFPLVYGLEIAWVWQALSDVVTVVFTVLLIPTGLFALGYARRMRTIVAHVGDRTASWFKLEAVARVRKAQDELVRTLDVMRGRYRQEVLGWDPLPARFTRRRTRTALVSVFVIGAVTTAVLFILFIRGYRDQPIQGLPLGPSPWQVLRTSEPAAAERELLRDAKGVLLAAQQLDRMQEHMTGLRTEFLAGDRSFLTQQDHDEIRALLLAYLDLRSALLKTVWLYRGDNTAAAVTTADPLEARAFLTAYTAAVLLVEKAWLIYDTFRDDPTTTRQLDREDLAWGIPAGTFSNIVDSLTNRSVMAELQMAMRRFESDRAAGRLPAQAPWSDLAVRAALSRPALEETLDGIGSRTLARTFRDMVRQFSDPASAITQVVSMANSRIRVKARPPHRGLISLEQLADLRAELKPGDILIERRNWYVSNSLLPGFWPHAALYLGSYEELAELGVAMDPRAAPHMSDFQGQNELGDGFAVIEAIGEGVIFTSFEQSVGEADAVAVLRPTLSQEEQSEAIGRALSHYGKEYDFDFDFETTDRLVCTELIFRAYDGLLEIPAMRLIMGRPRIAASDYVRMWADGQESGVPQLELVRFLDFDEPNGVAVEADVETLVKTLQRSRFTFLN